MVGAVGMSAVAGAAGAVRAAPARRVQACRARFGRTRAATVCMSARGTKDQKGRWLGMDEDISDDQADITRGKGMVDSKFQAGNVGGTGKGTHEAVAFAERAQKDLSNIVGDFYVCPDFMDKLVVHITKNFLDLPGIKVPLILGIWGGKGQGKSFQCELVFRSLGINPIIMSAGELESGNAGEPAKLVRQRYREASEIVKQGQMCALFINDLDAGAGRMGGTTQYTVNNQMVNATLMNIADNPTNVQLAGMYNTEDIPRVPIIVTGNDFSTLYAPLIRDGRMEKYYWQPSREDRIGIMYGIFKEDNVSMEDVATLVDTFPTQSVDFFGALRARIYDDAVRGLVQETGIDQMAKILAAGRGKSLQFDKVDNIGLETLLEYGKLLVREQQLVSNVRLAEDYVAGMAGESGQKVDGAGDK